MMQRRELFFIALDLPGGIDPVVAAGRLGDAVHKAFPYSSVTVGRVADTDELKQTLLLDLRVLPEKYRFEPKG